MPESQPAQPWPQAPATTDDAAVDSLLDVLPPLAAQPVAGHAAVYAGLHDALLTELNTEPNTGHAVPAPVPGIFPRTAD
ncbi:hypothetical protein [Arthrobacter sp. zg-Y877]|uniref:hypothetical protein n=1 Tax=Arthrobacter sp. zg-Y877 TaxID=3049074 RepID=UPI0025A48584|nr:hypothetical protein [Arthrobacter sp. zg-Y877]MDM7988841.1 hypothetical protein [Arthrobacter sp. zg-Y877]